MILWPEINFLAERDSWSLTLTDGKSNTSSDMDSGETRVRRRFTQTNSPLTFNVQLDADELAIFKYFFKEVLTNGARWFNMPTLDGQDYRINLVRFQPGNAPAVTPVGYRTYTVAMNLIVRELTQIDQSTYEYFTTLGFKSARVLSEAVTKFVNQVYPEISSEYR